MPEPALESHIRTALGTAQCIEISGEDARAFAQAQFSCDVRTLRPLHWQWAAWLDPKGRVRALMHLADAGDGRLIALLRGGEADTVSADLRRFVLRARVRIESMSDHFASAGPPLPVHEIRLQGDAVGFGYGERSLWLERQPRPEDLGSENAFRLSGIRSGWPSLPRGSENEFLPPALGLEHLGAVAFEKGCYPGQEIAARLHFRGGHKHRLAQICSTAPLCGGDQLEGSQGRARILDAVEVSGTYYALGVLEGIESIEFNKLDNFISVITRFEV